MAPTTDSSSLNIRTQFPHVGKVCWIGLRPGRDQPVQPVPEAEATTDGGLVGDRFKGKPGAIRQVTLIQQEHLDAVASMMASDRIDPALTRRNIVVSGINLTSLKGAAFAIGSAVFQGTGACAPCSKMERNLGAGGYNAMRGHGGITASVIQPGKVAIGDSVRFLNVVDTRNSDDEE
jgi:MOSC domain-containing protein YiiM